MSVKSVLKKMFLMFTLMTMMTGCTGECDYPEIGTSGDFALTDGALLRLALIAFSALAVALIWGFLSHTRMAYQK